MLSPCGRAHRPESESSCRTMKRRRPDPEDLIAGHARASVDSRPAHVAAAFGDRLVAIPTWAIAGGE